MKTIHRNYLWVLLICIVVCISSISASSPDNSSGAAPDSVSPQLMDRPVDPGYLQYVSTIPSSGGVGIQSADGNALGGLPRMYAPDVKDVELFELSTEGYEPNFDLRYAGKVTGVRNQNPHGTCWAHGALASLESMLSPGETYDFAEKNMVNRAGFDLAIPDGGGNLMMATAYLTRWAGPVHDSSDPYPTYAPWTSSLSYAAVKHVTDVFWLPARSDRSNTNNFKGALKTWGAVASGFWWDPHYYQSTNKAYYMPSGDTRDTTTPNHAGGHVVTIVGWDDGYSASNFVTPPPGNGAWIVKNSWGTGWGYDGYGYISYYDKYFASAVASDAQWDSAVFFAHSIVFDGFEYSYDPLGEVGYSRYYATAPFVGYFGNVFTASSAQTLRAVGFYTLDANVPYEVRIYTSPTTTPTTGTLYSSFTGTAGPQGYHTVNIPDSAQPNLASGQKFAVVIKVTNPTNSWTIPTEYPFTGYSSTATASAGQSWMSSDGSSWTDATSGITNRNVCVKAYTNGRALSAYVYDTIGIWRNGMWLLDYNEDHGWSGASDRMGSLGQSGDKVLAGRLNTDITTDICLFRNGMWLIDYNGDYQWGGTYIDRMGGLGQAGDTPLLGDWNGDGKKEIGIFRAGMWLLDYDGDFGWGGTSLDKMGGLGQSGDTPLVGDFNGDGKDEIGIFRAGMWLIDYNGDYGWSGGTLDRMGWLGQSGDTPLVGNWDSSSGNYDQKDEIGIFRAGMWLLDYNGDFGWSGASDRIGWLGQAGDTPIVGNWDSYYSDRIGIFRAGMWLLDYNGDFGWSGAGDVIGWLGQSGDTPVLGSWDGYDLDSVESASTQTQQPAVTVQTPDVNAPAVPVVNLPKVQTGTDNRPVAPGGAPVSPLSGINPLSAGVKIP